MDYEELRDSVLYNCDVSDAKHAGLYSVCGLVMRLRDLYKWERRLPPWQEDEPANVLAWIGDKEDHWEGLIEAEYRSLSLNGQAMDAFDTAAMNRFIQPGGFYYGAGYAQSLKPTFFLAEIDDSLMVDGWVVQVLGREHARDLLTLPAFSQDGQVMLRTEAGRMFLWDQILYMGHAGRRALEFAMQSRGLGNAEHDTIRHHFDTLWKVQKSICIQHEVGELEETVFDGEIWRRMLADYPHTPVELFIRTLRDLLADTGSKGALTHLIQNQSDIGLGLYMAFGNGITRMLTKPLICAFDAFITDGNWDCMAEASHIVRQEVASHTRRVTGIYEDARNPEALKRAQHTIEDDMRQYGLIR